MIEFYVKNDKDQCLMPQYATEYSACADLRSAIYVVIEPGQKIKVPTGIYIKSVDHNLVPKGMIPELQIRCRSGLSYKHHITLTNAVGTIDCDYPDEICVLLHNLSPTQSFTINRSDRIAQMCLNLVYRMNLEKNTKKRTSGFGSTGVK